MNKIFVFAVYTHRKSYVRDAEPCGDTIGYAVSESGEIINDHISSGIHWTQHDMGITSDWKHDRYAAKYPDGYVLVWLGGFESFDDAIAQINQ